jgi:hypothetical protein
MTLQNNSVTNASSSPPHNAASHITQLHITTSQQRNPKICTAQAPLSHNKRPRKNHNTSHIFHITSSHSNHGDAAAQARNSHGRVALDRAAVADLHEKNTSSAKNMSPPATNNSSVKKAEASITWPYSLYPQHDTAPPIDSAHE